MAWGPIHQYVFVLKLCKCYEFTSLYEPALSLPRCECVLGVCVFVYLWKSSFYGDINKWTVLLCVCGAPLCCSLFLSLSHTDRAVVFGHSPFQNSEFRILEKEKIPPENIVFYKCCLIFVY